MPICFNAPASALGKISELFLFLLVVLPSKFMIPVTAWFPWCQEEEVAGTGKKPRKGTMASWLARQE
jgi:hypothetical protein